MIRFEQVSVTYDGAARPSLRDADFTLPEGELTLLVGPSGVGKSTLLGAVSGLVPHFTGGTLRGRVTVAGRDTRTHMPRELADVVGTVGQDPLAHFVTDVVENELAYGMESLGLPPAVMRRRVEETLDLLGLNELRDRPITTLSGGQQQRVAIGSVLTTHPKVLVLDEPTSALDPAAAEEVLAVLQRLVHDLGTTVLMAEHRLERVVQYADRVLLLPSPGEPPVLGTPAEIMAVSPVHPPVVSLGRLAGWTPLPLSIRDARRLSGPLKSRLPSLPLPALSALPGAPGLPGSPALPGAPGVPALPGLSGAPGLPDVPGADRASEPGGGVAAAREESPTRPSTVPRGSAPAPAPQTPAGLNNQGSTPHPAPQAQAGLNNQGSTPHPAPQAQAGLNNQGSAPHPAPQAQAGLKDRGSASDPAPQASAGVDGAGAGGPGRFAQRKPASPAFEARGFGGGAPRGSGAEPRGTGEGRVGDQPRAAVPAPSPTPTPAPAPAPEGTATGPLARLRRLAGRRPKPQGTGPAGPPDAPAASARNLGVRRARTEVLHDVTLQVAPGETVALMGRNGAGKSTLLAALTGTLAPSTGQVTVGGRTPHRTPPPEMVRRVGLVPQEPRDLLYADTVAAECAAADADAGAAPGTCRALVGDLLPGVPDDTHPRDLSEGQRLTLALALVLTARPALLLLDEPTRGLDYAAKARLVATLRGLAADGHAIVLATHDVELAAELAHRVVILAGGEIVADGPTAEVVVSSPAFAPQVAKVLAPGHWLTVSQVAAALEATP
ncbi:ATP-binding cassette domain-containing protein [Streptomyces sp. WAC07149]|uniref:ATP-binding cassette domain-containing protein n=1 Tax=Streptomyces sp. WAC07149 TaxID=2487425 RepID=UPI000F788016|nr:ABC transporter ATP-binding protein [Streptomyces sp. WAC07149]RST03420.1 ATP-binding cassette domain-containing protein [Streptomyces sp. WAC07149]